MSHNIDISSASIYVGTYAKYNSSSLAGEWLNLSDYVDREDFYQACADLHADEEDPEYMFQDYENIPDGLISESSLSENFFELRDAIENFENDEMEAFFIWCSNNHSCLSSEHVANLVSDFREQYKGKYNSEEDFAMEEVDALYDLPDFALQYFDYERYANDLFCSDYWYSDGHVFCN